METKPVASPVTVALLAVLKSDLYVQKLGYNQAQRYNYAKETDFLDLVRPLLAAHGLILIPSYEIHSIRESQTRDGFPTSHITLIGTFTFLHVETGDRLPVRIIGQGTDSQDKGAYKAMTGALKYVLRQTFLIATGDDPEKDTETTPARPPAPSPANRPPASTGARPTSTSPAPEVPAGGGPAPLTVAFVDESTTKTGGTRFSAKFSNGVRASTFDLKDGEILKRAKAKNLPVFIETEQKGQFTNLTAIIIQDEKLFDDDVPFGGEP